MVPRIQRGTSHQSGTTHRETDTGRKSSRTDVGSRSEKSEGLILDQTTRKVFQEVLDTFVLAFSHLLSPPNVDEYLPELLQQIKTHLYKREFDAAFGSHELLEAYVTRWSPSRSLCYLHAFYDVFELLTETPFEENLEQAPGDIALTKGNSSLENKNWRIVCLGGGAAELAALAYSPRVCRSENHAIEIALVDKADWSKVLEMLSNSFIAPSSASDRTNGQGMPSVELGQDSVAKSLNYSHDFHQMDLLNRSTTETSILKEILHGSNVVTFMFTLNELYSSSVAAAQSLLLYVTSTVSPGTLLLVVDSAGSYSTVTINQKEKKYPMQWLLNYTLITMASKAASSPNPMWELLMTNDSRWFRLPEVSYPLELENMRYQQHIYRRI